jgi:hypothetical protein
MSSKSRGTAAALALAVVCALSAGRVRAADAPELAWAAPTAETKLWTRWWWLGNAVDRDGITQQLEQFQKAGLGGVEICPIYGTFGAENRYIEFLSPKWMDMLSHTYRETKRLEMAVDMTTGTGWPFGGPKVDAATASSSITLKVFDHYPAAEERPPGTVVAVQAIGRDGRVQDATGTPAGGAAGTRYLVAVSNGPVQKVKRAAPGGEGNVLDPYSVGSINKYLEEFDKAMEGFQDDIPRGQFHDSFEYYSATWTPEMFAEFQKRRGYDLKPHLIHLSGEGPADVVARVKHDYRETLSDLHQAYMDRWTEWSHQHGSIARNQAHGGPGNLVDVYAGADIPECEIFHLYEEAHLPMLKLSSSAAHVTGKKLSSAESFTWLGEHFNVSLAEVKPAADFLFLTGVNHMFLHGIPYSPPDAAWPGWQFYASVNFGPQGGLWRDFPAFADYVARCQSILQANKPSNEVLLYAPFHQFWTEADPKALMTQFTTPGLWMKPFPFYEAATAMWDRGVSYDEISDRLLGKVTAGENGTVTSGGNGYRAIVLPKTSVIPVDTMKKLLELVNGGATLVVQGELPADVPGLNDLEARRGQLKALLAPLAFRDLQPGIRQAAVGKGRVVMAADVPAALAAAGVKGEPMVKDGLRFIRRARPDGFDYFVVNRSEKAVDRVPLGADAQAAVVLDPRFADHAGVAQVRHSQGGDAAVDLRVGPGEAYFVRTFTAAKAIDGRPWKNFTAAANPVPLAGTWNVTFVDGGPVLPQPFSARQLASWTTRDDPEAKRFAGTAKYTLTFNAPANPNASDWQLDLGKVGDSARVTLNGKPLGALWAPPFALTLGDALRRGQNTLEVEVTNVAANRIADMDRRGVPWKIFRDINVVNTGYTAFDASKWPLRDAGLMGPVTLTPMRSGQ